MANQQQPTYPLATDDTVPPSQTLSGTWTAVADLKAITGTNGAAITQTQRGWWIYDATNDEIRQIEKVVSNNYIVLKKGFTNALSGATLRLIPANGMRNLSIIADGGINLKDSYDNNILLLDTSTFSRSSTDSRGSGKGLVNPFVVLVGANDANISYVL